MKKLMAALVAAAGLAMVGCSTEPKTEAEKSTLTSESSAAMQSFKNADSSLQSLLDRSIGYAVFPSVGKGGFIVGGAYGRGEVFEKGRKIGFADLTKGSVGLQAGAQTFDELIVFMTQEQMDKFKAGKFSLSADASAVAIKSGAAGASDYSKGVIIFTQTKGGLMAEASVGGQGFSYKPL
ncbi:MAG: lipid-binding SYLF domain-containing protein [Phycisphaerales bacterium]|nr:lipid-binding SYLF domain-containing protein [Phycisphaerales bacterium]